MHLARGNILAFLLFAASFALHIVGGATDQGWLFAVAVALIFVTATGYPAIATWGAGGDRRAAAPGAILGLAFTSSALWAANGRSFAWWEVPLGVVLVVVGSAALATVPKLLRR